MQKSEFPYKNIGQRIKQWREGQHESVDEVSGAVEIDTEELMKIEQGKILPSEDILLLLVSHLGVHETEAKRIFEQAGYARTSTDQNSAIDEQMVRQMLMVIPVDNRILYSDSINLSVNKRGMVFDFLQTVGNAQPNTVARIGMSIEHAKSVHKLLSRMIKESESPKKPRLLEAPKNTKSEQKKTD